MVRDYKLELETLKPEQFQRRTEIQNDLTNIASSMTVCILRRIYNLTWIFPENIFFMFNGNGVV